MISKHNLLTASGWSAIIAPPYAFDPSATGPVRSTHRAGFWSPFRRSSPSLVRTSGVDDDNAKFEDLAYDQAVTVFRACSPLRLPAELYSTPQGGWGNINLTYAAK